MQGEPKRKRSLADITKTPSGLQKNWDLAAKLYQASAQAGRRLSLGARINSASEYPAEPSGGDRVNKKVAAQGGNAGTYGLQWLNINK